MLWRIFLRSILPLHGRLLLVSFGLPLEQFMEDTTGGAYLRAFLAGRVEDIARTRKRGLLDVFSVPG